MIRELDCVVLKVDLPAQGLKQGDVGTVVLCHGRKGYEVEFSTLKGETLAVVTLTSSQVRAISRGEIAHARSIRAA